MICEEGGESVLWVASELHQATHLDQAVVRLSRKLTLCEWDSLAAGHTMRRKRHAQKDTR